MGDPAEFAEWKRIGEEELGFRHVESGPLVRSSYHAEKQARVVEAGGVGEIQEILEADIPAPAEVLSPRDASGGLVQSNLAGRPAPEGVRATLTTSPAMRPASVIREGEGEWLRPGGRQVEAVRQGR